MGERGKEVRDTRETGESQEKIYSRKVKSKMGLKNNKPQVKVYFRINIEEGVQNKTENIGVYVY